MDRRQRIAMQRALVREALGKLHAATELFSTEDGAVAGDDPGFLQWDAGIRQFETWCFGEGPLA